MMEPGNGKRGIEKQPFQLLDFIAATGIEKIRQVYIEKEDSKKLKQKQRERMQPRMGKMDIDYQVLHEAFFKYQTKPKLTAHGDLYHEGKEFEGFRYGGGLISFCSTFWRGRTRLFQRVLSILDGSGKYW